jgi:L-xylulokinase
MLEGSPTGAGNLEWFVAEFLDEKKQLLAQHGGGSVWKWADDVVAGLEPLEDDPLFLPFLYGSNVGAGYKACLIGMESRHGRDRVMRAVYEGCVFSHNWHLDRLCKFRPRPEAVSLTGGAAKSEVWVRMFADIFQLPVEVPEGTELGALGAALAAAVACGVHGSYEQAAAAMTRVARRQEPDKARAEVYAARYRKYRAAVAALEPFFKPSTIR